MLNFLKNLAGKTVDAKAEKPGMDGACSTEKGTEKKGEKPAGGCCGGHCH